ncbi:carbohydrate-binding module family 50 protein [Glonium stellatum]|uniref:Carbohydrate-binding module family 50 protein n=1 Tax=Glonium stellatum TaxID=574774 RepID=A0A8E2ES57_9PEZI|nr:carbohydrate-binding module family 50 protein [Glonium stellatum]
MTYTVVKGDSLSEIAHKFNITVKELEAANPKITNPDDIRIGEVLNIPKHPEMQPTQQARASSLNEDQKHALELHNTARQHISASTHVSRPALTWDTSLAADAQKYAQHLIDTNGFAHSGAPGVGENLAKSWPADSGSLAKGTQMWLDEEKNYHGEPIGQGDFSGYGHWTQCIWPTTTRVGVGLARGNGACVVVGRYAPPGNWTGKSAWTGK